jgi:hypothetical protein
VLLVPSAAGTAYCLRFGQEYYRNSIPLTCSEAEVRNLKNENDDLRRMVVSLQLQVELPP